MSLRDEMQDDLSEVFDTEELAELVLYKEKSAAQDAAPSSIPAHFYDEYEAAVISMANGTETTNPFVEVKATDTPNAKQGDSLVIRTRQYYVSAVQKSSSGITRLYVSKQK